MNHDTKLSFIDKKKDASFIEKIDLIILRNENTRPNGWYQYIDSSVQW